MTVYLDGNHLNLDDFMSVVRNDETVKLTDEAITRVKASRQTINDIVEKGKTVYGINTGFGKLSDVVINKNELSKLQENLLKSHACGVGEPFTEEITRGIMLLRINALAKGYSGVRLITLNQLLLYLNSGILPIIPEKGSLGASGDLAPLSHMALPLIGLGEVYYNGTRMNTNEALKIVNIEPLNGLHAKEGLSLINGTQVMTAVGAVTTYDAIQLSKTLDIAGSLTLEALYGIIDAMDPRVHEIRGHKGQVLTAKNIRTLTKGSEYITRQGEKRVQDAYSLRCMPQVHGASKDSLEYVKSKIEIEMNAATDNPLVFNQNAVISGGNFHGQPVALCFDFLKIALSEMANISERRIERLVNPQLNEGLPAFLVSKSGVNSGFMIMQYSAASLVSENKVLAHPASVDSIPSSANQEDHVSMGTIAARGARDILNHARTVIAIELLAGAQAIDLHKASNILGKGTLEAYKKIRTVVSFVEEDQIMYPFIEQVETIIKNEQLLNDVENVVGHLDMF
ncbi:histidine ammonia-lyase [Haloplasma contractile]|uniref:Histidine ammonia-lyase n=1 Tax=Haloplasma contractile SSD-17B TaxID=1033810 RepID=F7Q0J8_9MOLU|nr:histidine ammonia-lyase [Haloplasma contractile]ERJ12657.1 Histidine ammonia-lyase protein [Haloplasma contractile SSD-17B]